MKLTGFLLLALCLHVSARTSSQTITLKGKELSLRKVFSVIEEQTGFVVFSNRNLLSASKPVSVSVNNMPLTQFLQKIFQDQPLSYRIDNNTIILSRKLIPEELPLFPQDTVPKYVVVSGLVLDEKGAGVVGASVVLKGSTKGVTSNQEGRFNFAVPEGSKLVISSIGFQTTEINAEKGNVVVQLEPSARKLDDVVVTGIFTRRTESFTGSAQTYSKEELLKVGTVNVIQSLKNIDPSFNIRENLEVGSNPNVLPTIHLRGQSGFPDLKGEYQTDPNLPLFILDGFEVPLTRVIDLDMNRVETITLLKDASAKAIYGSKAANGVVVIETQRPKAGKMQVSYTGVLNVSAPDLSSYNLANAAEKLDVEKAADLYRQPSGLPDAALQYPYDEQYNKILEEVLRGVNTDWISKPVRTGLGQKHTMYVEGGSEFFRYGVDFSYNKVEGVMKGSSRTTTSGGVTLSYRYRNLLLRNNIDVSYNKGNESPLGSFTEFTNMNPYFRSTDAQGRITRIAGENLILGGAIGNPLWNGTINTKNFSEYTQLVNNFYAEYTLTNGMKFTGRTSVTRKENGSEAFYPASHTMFINYTTEELVKRKGRYIHGDGTETKLYVDLNGNYSKSIGDHFFFVNAGWSLGNSGFNSTTIQAEGFPNDFLDDLGFARQYVENSRPAGNESRTRDIGLLSFLNYSYADRFLFDGSFRMNASSQFGADNRWGKFWSVGLAWNLHNETFADGWTFIDQLKIRGSLGYTGSQNFNSYQAKTTFSYNTNDAYLGHYGAYLLSIGNSSLKWQRKYDQNIGVDLSALKRALTFRFDYYVSNTDDLLTEVTLPSSTGFLSYKENLGKVKNVGYELRVGYRVWNDRRKSGNSLSLFVAASHNKNTILRISNSLDNYNKQQAAIESTKTPPRYIEGQSLTAIWAVPSYGIDPASGRDIFVTPDGSITHTWSPANLAVVGDEEPYLRGNAGLNFDYNGWSLNLSTNWQFGGQIYNSTLVEKVENADLNFNVDRRIFSERWRTPGDLTMFRNIRNRATVRPTERFVEDKDEWALTSVNLSYDLNRLKAFRLPGLNRLRASFNMNDALLVSSVRVERGTAYPFARSFSFSIQAMF